MDLRFLATGVAEQALDRLQRLGWPFAKHPSVRDLGQPRRHVERHQSRSEAAQGLQVALDAANISPAYRPGKRLRHAEPLDVLGHATKKRPEHERAVAFGNARTRQELRAPRGERCGAVGHETCSSVVGDAIETSDANAPVR